MTPTASDRPTPEPPDPVSGAARGSHRTAGASGPPAPATLAGLLATWGDGTKVPWLLRASANSHELDSAQREQDRLAALAARRTSLLVLPIVTTGWLVTALVGSSLALRVGTVIALAVSVVVGARAATTTQRFRRRWVDPDEVTPPQVWITLLTVGVAVAAMVAIANAVSDLQAGRTAFAATIISVVCLGVVGLGAFAHIAGGRSVGAALRDPRPDDPGPST